MFHCDRCGLCCMRVSISSEYRDLDRGDGICRHFDCKTKLCRIYENRPVKCNVDLMYEMHFKNRMGKEEYYQMNYFACEMLKKEEQKNVSYAIKT